MCWQHCPAMTSCKTLAPASKPATPAFSSFRCWKGTGALRVTARLRIGQMPTHACGWAPAQVGVDLSQQEGVQRLMKATDGLDVRLCFLNAGYVLPLGLFAAQ